MSSVTDIVGQGSHKTHCVGVLWERGGAGAQSEGFSQENRANVLSADDGSSVTPLLSVNLPGFRRGDPMWSPVNGKNFISMPSSSARDQFCSLRGFAPYDRFFLYPTEVLLLWDFAVQSTAVLHFSRAATRVSGSGDHIGSPLRVSVLKYGFHRAE